MCKPDKNNIFTVKECKIKKEHNIVIKVIQESMNFKTKKEI